MEPIAWSDLTGRGAVATKIRFLRDRQGFHLVEFQVQIDGRRYSVQGAPIERLCLDDWRKLVTTVLGLAGVSVTEGAIEAGPTSLGSR